MSNKAKAPAFNIEQIKQALQKGGKGNEIKLDDIDLHSFKPTSATVLRRINALKHEQLKFADLEAKFFEEMHTLECKYQTLYQPIFEKRRQIVNGEYEPNEEESKWTLDQVNGHEEAKKEENGTEKAGEEEKGIPNFWLETLQSLRMTAELIQEPDEAILAYLTDIQCKYFDQKPYGYTLEFHFAENPYFTNKVLTKTYELKIEVDAKDPFSFEGPDLDKVNGCKIDWKAGKNVTVKLIKKKIKSKNKKQPPKVVTKEEKQDSFFNFFDTPKVGVQNGDEKAVAIRKSHTEDEDEADEEDADEILMFADFEIAQQIREKVVPKAVLYFTGELDDMDEDDYDDYDEDEEDEDEEHDDEDEEEEDEDEDDDDDEDDDEDEGGKKGGKGKGAKHGGGGAAGKHGKGGAHAGGKHAGAGGKGGEPTPSECKQN